MKVAITGHTSGIGQGLYRYFQSHGHEVKGYSRTNGYALPDNQMRVLDEIKDCDIFVNNALPVDSQIFLLKELWPLWVHLDKKIIVINSIASHMPWVIPYLKKYQEEKKELHELCKKFRYESDVYGKCLLIGIHPGYVTTNIFTEFNEPTPPEDLSLSVAQVVDIVDFTLNSPVKIDDIVFRR